MDPEIQREIEKLARGADLANRTGQTEAARVMVQRIADLKSGAAKPTVREEQAADFQARTRRAVTEAAPDYTKSMIFMGRGFDTLLKGAEQLTLQGMNVFSDSPLRSARLAEIEKQRQMEDRVYEPLAEDYGPSAVLGEMVGEAGPFSMLPAVNVTRIPGAVGRFAQRGIVGAPLRAAPEAAYAASEEALLYQRPEDEDVTEAAASAGAVSLVVDRLSRGANVRRGRMNPDVQEYYDLGQEFEVPVRAGSIEEQTDAARRATGRFASGADLSDSGERIVESFRTGVQERAGDFEREYRNLWFDSEFSEVTAPGVKLQVLQNLEDLDRIGSMANPNLRRLYQKWMDLPDEQLNLRDLHNFRSDLRAELRTMGPEAGRIGTDVDALENVISDQIYMSAEAIQPGLGQAIKDIDTWYYEDLGRLRRIPQARQALGENPRPRAVAQALINDPGPNGRRFYEALTETGRQAVTEAMFNLPFRAAERGREFNPLQYANWVKNNDAALKQFLGEMDYQYVTNLGKLMDYIAKEGKTADNNLLRLIRGFPFMYRAVGDAVRRSNWRYLVANAPPDIRPGSPAMEAFYNNVIRQISVQGEEEGEALRDILGRGYDAGMEAAQGLREGLIGRPRFERPTDEEIRQGRFGM